MAGRKHNKWAVILCVFCLSYGLLSGASYARGENLEDTESTVQDEESQTRQNTTEEQSPTADPMTTEQPTTTEERTTEEPTATEEPATATEEPATVTEEPTTATEEPVAQPKSYAVKTGIVDQVVLVPEKTVATTAADNRESIPCLVNGISMSDGVMVNGTPYVCAVDFCNAMGLNATYSTDEKTGALCIDADGFYLVAQEDLCYFQCNNRFLYVQDGVKSIAGSIFLPVDELAKCVGAVATMDMTGWNVDVCCDKIVPLENGDEFYNESDVYWLSHVIYSESGNQELRGQLAVGNVVTNRVASDVFPNQNSIYNVIFAKSQFDVVTSGRINMTPSAESIVAAKLALEGYNVVPDALFFATFFFGSRYVCVTWIGAHCFMSLA